MWEELETIGSSLVQNGQETCWTSLMCSISFSVVLHFFPHPWQTCTGNVGTSFSTEVLELTFGHVFLSALSAGHVLWWLFSILAIKNLPHLHLAWTIFRCWVRSLLSLTFLLQTWQRILPTGIALVVWAVSPLAWTVFMCCSRATLSLTFLLQTWQGIASTGGAVMLVSLWLRATVVPASFIRFMHW